MASQGAAGSGAASAEPAGAMADAAADAGTDRTIGTGYGEVDQVADTVVSGTATTYTITVTNLGPDAADGATVTVTGVKAPKEVRYAWANFPEVSVFSAGADVLPAGPYRSSK